MITAAAAHAAVQHTNTSGWIILAVTAVVFCWLIARWVNGSSLK